MKFKTNHIRAIGITTIILAFLLIKMGMVVIGIIFIAIEILLLIRLEFFHHVKTNGQFNFDFPLWNGFFFYINAEKQDEENVFFQIGIMKIQ